jgi:hypothetical protein
MTQTIKNKTTAAVATTTPRLRLDSVVGDDDDKYCDRMLFVACKDLEYFEVMLWLEGNDGDQSDESRHYMYEICESGCGGVNGRCR